MWWGLNRKHHGPVLKALVRDATLAWQLAGSVLLRNIQKFQLSQIDQRGRRTLGLHTHPFVDWRLSLKPDTPLTFHCVSQGKELEELWGKTLHGPTRPALALPSSQSPPYPLSSQKLGTVTASIYIGAKEVGPGHETIEQTAIRAEVPLEHRSSDSTSHVSF